MKTFKTNFSLVSWIRIWDYEHVQEGLAKKGLIKNAIHVLKPDCSPLNIFFDSSFGLVPHFHYTINVEERKKIASY